MPSVGQVKTTACILFQIVHTKDTGVYFPVLGVVEDYAFARWDIRETHETQKVT